MSPPELPPIDPDLHADSTEDILRRGVLVPILQTEDGEVLDGRLRLAIAQEHGLYCPRIIVGKLSPEERADLRVAVNLYRRHLSRQQVRHLVEWALRQEPEASDRSVAGRTGVDHKTVGAARRRLEAIGEIPQFDARSTLNGRRYPSSRKPIVITSSDSQAREASRLLDELGDDAPDENAQRAGPADPGLAEETGRPAGPGQGVAQARRRLQCLRLRLQEVGRPDRARHAPTCC